MRDDEVASRAIGWIREHFGEISDLGKLEAKVVWVTVYRAMEVGLGVEQGGGERALTKDSLLGHGRMNLSLKEAMLKLDFLLSMIPAIRESRNIADSAVLIETLKYGILDVADKSILRRALERMFRSVDPMYSQSIPTAVYERNRGK